ncbi:hypothetical protein SEA_HITCHHIKER_53 [Microbacterium phage HitchHiker]
MTAAAADKSKTADKRTASEKHADDDAKKARDEIGLKESTAETKAKDTTNAPLISEDGHLLNWEGENYVLQSYVQEQIDEARVQDVPNDVESDDQDPEDANDFLNKAWASLANELDDGVAKDQVLGALTAVQTRAREVVLEHAARRA